MPIAKIGRNDPCFCGSGKKYKFCCMGKPAQVAQRSDLPFQTVSEAFALRALLVPRTPFHVLYDAERPKIAGDIYWTNNLPMPPGLEAQAIRLPTSTLQVIYLRHMPAAVHAALAVAHELMHLVLDAEGFPYIASTSQHQALAALLNSVGQDALIDGRLRQYGFDIAKKVQKEIKVALASLANAEPPLDRTGRMMWVLNYAGQVLECTIAAPHGTGEQLEAFQGWFRAHHPAIAADGDALLAGMKERESNTPHGMRAFFTWAIQHYGLPDDFVVNVQTVTSAHGTQS